MATRERSLPRELAFDIWKAGVERVQPTRLIEDNVRCESGRLSLCSTELDLIHAKKICVVGAGKATGGLAVALADALQPIAEQKCLHGLVNVPADCVQDNAFVKLHPGRPAGVNEPREEGVAGTQEMLRMVGALHPNDICICLISGGGSALLPAPIASIALADKLAVTRLLSSRGASIQELNGVRIALSEVKGGGLARACNANRIVTLIVSDIIGDPLGLIASGPTIDATLGPESPDTVLSNYAKRDELSSAVWKAVAEWTPPPSLESEPKWIRNHLLANNHTAVQAAVEHARSLGFETTVIDPELLSTTAEEVATRLVQLVKRDSTGRHCIVWGGEPVVHIADNPGRGGRNQQLALSVLNQWGDLPPSVRQRLCVLSGGTDGEDGPTDAAGAMVDAQIVQAAYNQNLDSGDSLMKNDAYTFFEAVDGLVKTGPTHTNVCDLRISVVVGGSGE